MTETMDLQGLEGVVSRIVGAINGADYTETLTAEAAKLREIHRSYFQSESGPDGEQWTPWYFRRRGTNPDHKTLDVTGRLKRSVTEQGGEHIEEITDQSITFGSSVPYGYKHQDGGEYEVDDFLVGKRGGSKSPGDLINLPKREFIGINGEHLGEIARDVACQAAQIVVDAIDVGKG